MSDRPLQMRLVVEVDEYDEAVRFYRDVLGAPVELQVHGDGGEKVTILDALGLHDAAVAACEAGLDKCPGSALLRAALAPAERARVRSGLKVLRGGAG